ncbi:MAG: hypothetical protein IPP46_04550 [Bacteroidetes bacterium]|nr:hypothetical protein [Bacteroidota bacterium]
MQNWEPACRQAGWELRTIYVMKNYDFRDKSLVNLFEDLFEGLIAF